ncbi:MAG: hypothetical protein WCL43_04995 [Chlorobium sp.]|jgi:hypothetical protein|nr:MAG: hypothetical protein FDX12_02205 [Chlorobium sp.]
MLEKELPELIPGRFYRVQLHKADRAIVRRVYLGREVQCKVFPALIFSVKAPVGTDNQATSQTPQTISIPLRDIFFIEEG